MSYACGKCGGDLVDKLNVCLHCKNTGKINTGKLYPWGDPIYTKCSKCDSPIKIQKENKND